MSVVTILKTAATIARRGAKLAGANSHTTKAQYGVLLGTAIGVAALGYFVPALAGDVVATALIAAVAPLVSRLVLYKAKPNRDNDVVMLAKVQQSDDSREWWETWDDCLGVARTLGYARGVDYNGYVWDVTTGEMTGDKIQLPGTGNAPEGYLHKVFTGPGGTDNRGDISTCSDNTDATEA